MDARLEEIQQRIAEFADSPTTASAIEPDLQKEVLPAITRYQELRRAFRQMRANTRTSIENSNVKARFKQGDITQIPGEVIEYEIKCGYATDAISIQLKYTPPENGILGIFIKNKQARLDCTLQNEKLPHLNINLEHLENLGEARKNELIKICHYLKDIVDEAYRKLALESINSVVLDFREEYELTLLKATERELNLPELSFLYVTTSLDHDLNNTLSSAKELFSSFKDQVQALTEEITDSLADKIIAAERELQDLKANKAAEIQAHFDQLMKTIDELVNTKESIALEQLELRKSELMNQIEVLEANLEKKKSQGSQAEHMKQVTEVKLLFDEIFPDYSPYNSSKQVTEKTRQLLRSMLLAAQQHSQSLLSVAMMGRLIEMFANDVKFDTSVKKHSCLNINKISDFVIRLSFLISDAEADQLVKMIDGENISTKKVKGSNKDEKRMEIGECFLHIKTLLRIEKSKLFEVTSARLIQDINENKRIKDL